MIIKNNSICAVCVIVQEMFCAFSINEIDLRRKLPSIITTIKGKEKNSINYVLINTNRRMNRKKKRRITNRHIKVASLSQESVCPFTPFTWWSVE